jgi:hypothetical protein
MRFSARLSFRALLGRVSVLALLAVLSGCDVPTEIPLFDVRWVIPIDSTSIPVSDLLPADVAVSGGNFQLTVGPVGLTQTLGALCPACILIDGSFVPTPAFNISYQNGGTLPTDVVSATLASGSISIDIQNNLGFDPIRPAVADPGTMTITIHDVDAAGPVIGQVVLDGATDAIPNGALTNVSMPLTPGSLSPTFVVVIDLDTPAGDTNVLIDINATLDITAIPGAILVSSATLDVDGRAVGFPQTTLDVVTIDPDIVSRILNGALIVDVQNPFGVAISVQVEIGAPGIVTLQRTLDIGSAPTSSVALNYTGAEFQSFLGQPGVFFRGNGAVDSPGVPATVTPIQEVVIETSLDLTLEIGG